MADNVVGIVFGVAGGKSLSGESGALIKSQLDAITSKIKLKVNIDRPYFSKQLEYLKKELDNKLGKLKVTITTSGASGENKRKAPTDTDKIQEQKQKYSELKKQLKELYKTYAKFDKIPDKDSSTATTLESQLVKRLQKYEDAFSEASNKKLVPEEQLRQLEELKADLVAARKAQTELNEATQQEKMASGMQTSYKGLIANIESLNERYSDLIKHNKEAAAVMENLRKVASEPYKGTDHIDSKGKFEKADYVAAAKQIQKLAQTSKEAAAQFSKLEVKTDTLGKKLRETFTNKIIQSFAYMLIGLATRALKQVYDNVIALDSAITDLQIATGKTREETSQLVSEYARLAQQIGATALEVTEAADTWLRQGYDIAETNKLIENTMMLAKLGQMSSAEAAKALTSAMKGYKVEVEDAIRIVDKFTAVDMDAAVSAGYIATAMAETAASAEVAGIEMDTLIGYISTVGEVTQDGAESVGTFFKTLFARIGNVKAGKFVDDQTGENLNDVEKVLGALGISLRNEEGLFKDFGLVLDEVGEKWDSFNNIQQHAIATAFAGTRQQEKFIVLMENYATALEYANVAANSTGTAKSKYNDAYMDSIEAKMDSLAASWQEFSMSLLNSDLFKGVLDILQMIINVLNTIGGVGDGILIQVPLIIAALATVYSILLKIKGSEVWSGFLSGLKKIFAPITRLIAALKQKAAAHRESATAASEDAAAETAAAATMDQAAKKTALSAGSIIGSIVTAAAALGIIWTIMDNGDKWVSWVVAAGAIIVGVISGIGIAVKIATAVADKSIKSFMASNPIGWILALITAITSLVMAIVNLFKAPSYEDLKEAADEAKTSWQEFNDALEETKSELEEINEQIAELQEKIDKGEPLTLVEEKQLAALNQAKAIAEQQIIAQEEQANSAGRLAQDAVGEALDKYNSEHKDRVLNLFSKASNGNWKQLTDSEKEEITDYMSEIYGNLDEFEYYTPEYDEDGNIVKGIEDWQASINSYWDDYYAMLDRMSIAQGEYDTAWDSILSREKFSTAIDALKNYANGAHVTAEGLEDLIENNESVKELFDYLSEIGLSGSLESAAEQIKDLADGLSSVAEQSYIDLLGNLSGAFDVLSNSLEDIKENGIIAQDTLEELLKDYPDLAEKFFQLTDQGYQLNGDYEGMSNDEILRQYATEQLQAYVDEYERCQKELEEHKDDDFSAQAETNAANALENLNNALATYATLLRTSELEAMEESLESQKDALEEQLDVYNELIDLRKELLSTYEEEIEYKKELSEKQTSVADLQTQLRLAQLDTSAAGQARARELQSELDDAQAELNDFTLENAIDKLQDYLDADSQEYEAFINQKVDELEETIENLAKNFKLNINTESNPITITPEYHKGGFVGNVVKLKSNEEFAKLLEGERVSTPAQIDRFMKRTLPSIASGGSPVINNNSPLIEFRCGDISSESLPEIKDLVSQAVTKIEKNMESALSRTGYRKNK